MVIRVLRTNLVLKLILLRAPMLLELASVNSLLCSSMTRHIKYNLTQSIFTVQFIRNKDWTVMMRKYSAQTRIIKVAMTLTVCSKTEQQRAPVEVQDEVQNS